MVAILDGLSHNFESGPPRPPKTQFGFIWINSFSGHEFISQYIIGINQVNRKYAYNNLQERSNRKLKKFVFSAMLAILECIQIVINLGY